MPGICFAMHEIRRSLIAAVLILPLSGCAKPSYIKNASGHPVGGIAVRETERLRLPDPSG